MAPVIQQRVRFRTSPQALFRPLTRLAPPFSFHWRTATISRKVGGKFKAFEGQLEGQEHLDHSE